MVCKKSLAIWKGNCNKILDYSKVCLHSNIIIHPQRGDPKLNRLIFKFLWKGVDKVTRLSTINDYQRSCLKMIDLETMVKYLRLSWLNRIFSENNGTWKTYLRHQLKNVGDLFLFHCNYDIKDVVISSQFYSELLQWWSEFREDFSSEKLYQNIIWNNKDIRINDKPIFSKTFFNSGLTLVSDLRIDLDITDSYHIIAKKIEKSNFLIWSSLRLAILPAHLIKLNLRANDHTFLTMPPSMIISNNDFNNLTKNQKTIIKC